MIPYRSARVLAVTALLVLSNGTSLATTLILQPSSQDAYVTQQQPNHVFGSGPTNTRIFVQSSTPNPRVERGLVQFDLPIPQSSTINSATLQINEQSGNLPNTRTHGAHRVTTSWLQSTVKWNTQPSANLSPTSTAVVGDSRGFKSFVVTADVQAFVNNPSSNFGWMIRDQNEGVGNQEVGYVAREETHIPDIPKEPILTIDFTSPPCTTNADCQDTNACTTNERCEAGHCAVNALSCDDNNACTDDICDPQQGCLHPVGECNDGFSCTIDSCNAQLGCVHTPVPSVCAHNGCQTGNCVADQNDQTLDPVTGCFVTSVAPNGSGCSDGNGCTLSDTCQGGECISGAPVTCTAEDQCHNAGTCNPSTGTCSNPAKPDGTACNDGSACTQTDQCASGACTGGNPIVCSALDQCHVAGSCDPGSGLCANPNKADGSSCDDGNACTQTDQCSSGSCSGGNSVVCSPLDQCHVAGTCNPGSGICSNPSKPDGSTCSDGNACTQTDQCSSGTCSGGNPVVCSPLDQCHVAGTCNPGSGTCSNPNKSDGSTCSDGNACTQTDQCSGGSCSGGNPIVCAPLDQCHDAGTCDTGTGLCSNPPKPDGATCSDGNACTQTDQCTGGSCGGGNPVVCAALDQCHDAGTCDAGTGICSNPSTASGTACNDGNACTQTDRCNGGGQCAGANPIQCTPLDDCHVAGSCDPQTGTCSNPAATDGTTCSDGNTCTLGDACAGGQCLGDPMTCGDGVVQPSCNEECDDATPGANCTARCRFICGPTPQAGCRQPTKPGKALLILKKKTPDKRNVLVWKWTKGAATTVGDFGTPLATTGYTLCVYDSSASGQPLILAMAPPGGTCAGKPCWKSLKGGFKYKDRDLTPNGLLFLLEKAGLAGSSKIIIKGKGAGLGVPTLPLTPAVTVQLKKNDDPGVCWEAIYTTPSKNLPEQFKSKAN